MITNQHTYAMLDKAVNLLDKRKILYWKDLDIRAAVELVVDEMPNYKIVSLGTTKDEVIYIIETELRVVRGDSRLRQKFAIEADIIK